ncbi:hypothetical protein LLH03_19805 [bacterium]|nr:hypothetical protein [bacterium]
MPDAASDSLSTETTTEPRPVAQWEPRRDPLVWLIVIVYFALAVTTGFVHELGYAPDETSRHYPYVQWLAKEHRIPPADYSQPAAPLNLHPPLYYLAMVPVYLLAAPYGNRVALRALRLTSPFLILPVILMWFGVIRRACGNDRRTTLFAFALTAWWPNLFVDAGMLNNDVGTLLILSGLLYLIVAKQWQSRSLGSAALWGALLGVGGLVKTSVPVAGVPVVAVALVWQHGRSFWRDGRFWTRGMLAAATCVALCGWWFLRNLELFGSLTCITRSMGFCMIPAGLSNWDAIVMGIAGKLLLRAINGLWVSVFAGAVWFPDWSHPVVYGVLRLLTALGVIGVVVGLWRLKTGKVHFAPGQVEAILLPVIGFAVLYLSDLHVSVFVHAGFYQGGRYLLPFLPGLTIPLALGLRQLCPARARNGLGIVVALFFLCLNFLSWYHIITYWNPYVLQTAGRFQ